MTRPSWLQTFTGKQYLYVDPRPEMICIEDIAHALSNQCRFAGQCRTFYSVGQHSLLASAWVASYTKCAPEERRKLEMLALLHDASEAYLVDVPAPVKPLLQGYAQLETLAMGAIATKFRLDLRDFSDPRIKHIDMVMLATEKRDLLGPEPAPWLPMPEPGKFHILPEPPHIVEEEFLARFKQLGVAS